ncbi:ASL_C2 domain-containing protein [Trichoderma simmonsii]|uniref:ASL_C2 domain-containing protein n=1 Tax=Trichoderma simmonsii TaxID=1491479 RepID=A0A8G0L6U7_9HYPO|nr:ASL_C2 domain-containing protein [Trichoderma simmonsii]
MAGLSDRDLLPETLQSLIPQATVSRYYECLPINFNKEFPSERRITFSGQCVAKLEETGIPMNGLSLKQRKVIDSRFEEDIAEALVYETSVKSSSNGGTSKSLVLEQIHVIKAALSGIRGRD